MMHFKNNLLALLFLVLVTAKGFGQTISTKNSEQLSIAKTDTAKISTLLKFSQILTNEDPSKSIRYSEYALLFSKQLRLDKKIAASLNSLAWAHFVAGNYSMSLKSSLEVLNMAQKLKDTISLARAYNTIGNVYRRQGAYNSAISNLKRAMALSGIFKKTNGIYQSTLGITFLENGQTDSAMFHLQNAYQISIQSKTDYMPLMYNRLGDLQFKLNNKKLAIEYYYLGIKSAIENRNPRLLCFNYVSIANLYQKENLIDSSILYGTKAYEIGKNKFLQQAQQAAKILSDDYLKLNQSDNCLKYLRIAMSINDTMLSNKEESEIKNLEFEERLQKIEIETGQAKLKLERSHNLQNSAIAAILIIFIIIFLLLSHSVLVNESVVRSLGILSLLIVFEFINLLIHPYLGELVHHSPVLMLGIMVLIALLLIPLHHKLEHWITDKMVEKNKKIRLAAAKKIIAELEKENP